ncbi:MAG: T9SS type A sorting domain-containing protein [Flavobacteriales bacterium]|nr:T9SS type A sorting domain-containing protein [Flavobacteriales bacterium]
MALSSANAQLPTNVDISLDHDPANQLLRVRFRANDLSFNELLSSVVFTIRWSESSTATLGFGASPWCPSPSVAFPVTPSSVQTPGNGYKYRTWTSIALVALGDLIDDGGCEQSLPADEWVIVHEIPISNDPGGTAFEIAADQWTLDNNRAYFVSLNGVDATGSIFNSSTGFSYPESATTGFTIQPNPANQFITLSLPERTAGLWQAEVFDAAGRSTMLSNGQHWPAVIDVKSLKPGVYSATISVSGSLRTERFIIAR